MKYNLEKTLEGMNQLNIQGNIIPHAWFLKITFEKSKKPDLLSMIILADILYWYRPIEVRDEKTGSLIGLKKKFKRDMLQRSIQSFAKQLGVSRRQVSDALRRLSEKKLIIKELREISTPMGKLGNVLFLAPKIENIAKLQTDIPLMQSNAQGSSDDSEYIPLCNEMHKGMPSNAHGHVIKRGTYTENTTKNTTTAAAKERHENKSPSTADKKTPQLAAAAFLKQSVFDTVIGETLTDNQRAIVHHNVFQKLCQQTKISSPKELCQEIEYALLDSNCFRKTGHDFHYKLNVIKKTIRDGKWTTPAGLTKENNTSAAFSQAHPTNPLANKITTVQQQLDSLQMEYRSFEAAIRAYPDEKAYVQSHRNAMIKKRETMEALKTELHDLQLNHQQQPSQGGAHHGDCI